MSCCDETLARVPNRDVSRRTLIRGAAAAAGILATAVPRVGRAQGKRIRLSFCSQLLCIIPYEVARADGHFRNHGLDVELVYTRGGNAAMQALVGGAVEYGATSLDVALQAYAHGAEIRRFATTGRLPLFAVATAPGRAGEIREIKDLVGRTVGISALGNADHALLLFLLRKAGADATKVQFATLGTNILEALRQGQVDAGLVQEPALTLLEKSGARVLVNAMDSADAQKYLGGPYEFMGVAVLAKDVVSRHDEMVQLALALQDALQAMPTMSGKDMVAALPREMKAGADLPEMEAVLERYRGSLYPTRVAIDLDASKRVADTLASAGLLPPGADTSGLQDTTIMGG
jgi:NitT/TauT family transport system substrate-binding protein